MSAATTSLGYSSTTWGLALVGLACFVALVFILVLAFMSAIASRDWDARVAAQDATVDRDREQFAEIWGREFGPPCPSGRRRGKR